VDELVGSSSGSEPSGGFLAVGAEPLSGEDGTTRPVDRRSAELAETVLAPLQVLELVPRVTV